MRELVPFVVTLVELAGGFERATSWATALQTGGLRALRSVGLTTDVRILLEREAARLGLVDEQGEPVPARSAELAIVADIVSAVPPPRKPAPRTEPLVFTVPREAAHLVTPAERLDTLVADVIRSATANVSLGGPFWNAEGFAMLRPLLQPAIEIRGVACDFYAFDRTSRETARFSTSSMSFARTGRVKLWWYAGQTGSLMHAKFCVADETVGYFGSANLTSLGLAEHVEIGVKLTASQCIELLKLLDVLMRAGLFRPE